MDNDHPTAAEQAEFEGANQPVQPGFVALPSGAIMDHVHDVAGRVGGHGLPSSPYRNVTGFVPGQVESFDVINPGAPSTQGFPTELDTQLGFPAHSIVVDNPTKQWLFVGGGARRLIPPGVLGYCFQVPRASTKAEVDWQPPDGVAQPALGTATTATLHFCEAFLMPSPGTAIGVGL